MEWLLSEKSLSAVTLARAFGNTPGFAWLDGDGSVPEGTWSFVAWEPVQTLRLEWGQADWLDAIRSATSLEVRLGDLVEDGIPSVLSESDVPRWVGYIAYDAASHRRHRRQGFPERAPPGLPVLWLCRYDAVVAIHHPSDRAYVVGDSRSACERTYEAACSALDSGPPKAIAGVAHTSSKAIHRRAIASVHSHIREGDVYQVNLARRFRADFEGAALALCESMRVESPVPLGGFFHLGDASVVCRSMERFLRWNRRERSLVTRPIKGTCANFGHDEMARRSLASDPKEIAEHTMIVDLMRNDLGKVAEPGSVRVPALMEVEPYRGLWHMVSTVTCTTRKDVAAADVLSACFPPGSITGAPKHRAMEIIDALEPEARGVYTGAIGYIDRSGGMSFAVAIRTAVVARGCASYYAGGGIVWESDADKEIAETELKAQVFLRALRRMRLSSSHPQDDREGHRDPEQKTDPNGAKFRRISSS